MIQHAPSDIPQPITSNVISLNLPSKHCSFPTFLSSHSCVGNHSEMESQFPRSQTQFFDERDDLRALSPISLKSDMSLAGHATEAGNSEVRTFSGESICLWEFCLMTELLNFQPRGSNPQCSRCFLLHLHPHSKVSYEISTTGSG